jgi:hypothetical protein
MKLLGIIIIIALTGCGQVNQEENGVETAPQLPETFTQPENHKDNSKFPDWLTQLYPTEIKLDYQTIRQALADFKTVNDSVVYCIYRQMDGVCEGHFLATYVNKEPKDSIEIGHNCDHDLSIPSYTWKEFAIKSSDIILTTEYTESVHDSLIDENGWMKKEYIFLEAETTVDTARQVFQVDQQGQIIEIEKKQVPATAINHVASRHAS